MNASIYGADDDVASQASDAATVASEGTGVQGAPEGANTQVTSPEQPLKGPPDASDMMDFLVARPVVRQSYNNVDRNKGLVNRLLSLLRLNK